MAWELSDDEINGVTIAVNTILRGSYNAEGMRAWWERPRRQLGGKTPVEAIAADPTSVVELALSSLEQGGS
jgi:hypothetical protein